MATTEETLRSMREKNWEDEPTNRYPRLLRYFDRERGFGLHHHVAIFDLGTRAVRVLVAPRVLESEDWNRERFYNAASMLELGTELVRNGFQLSLSSLSLARTIEFVIGFRDVLVAHGFRPEDFYLVGTAVFRWMRNREEVLRYLFETTALTPSILDDRSEALAGLDGLLATYRVPASKATMSFPTEAFRLVLIDQGGGSTEVSSAVVGREDPGLITHSFDLLGSMSLRERFLSPALGTLTSRSVLQRWLAGLEPEVEAHIESELEPFALSWTKGAPLIGYAVGTAIVRCSPLRNNHDLHNQLLDLSQLEGSRVELRERIHSILDRGRGDFAACPGVEYLLDRLLGLAVYRTLLRRFGLTTVRLCGYGLRYGVYWGRVLGRSIGQG
ncbi:MAG: hypothetical protein A2284_09610 [Deltaproteobacteria bacterium RIFOXYA12_FULL_61_11]|nr:MAG: hypothetical protein A2284_09610 [Deltaproteobacteria bacterium RIFOXYA12_FULL_61_11]